jgi:hypothetical protein
MVPYRALKERSNIAFLNEMESLVSFLPAALRVFLLLRIHGAAAHFQHDIDETQTLIYIILAPKLTLIRIKTPTCVMTRYRNQLILKIILIRIHIMSRDSVVGIATGYGLDDRGVGVRVPVGSRIFPSPCCPDRLWGPPSLL